MAGVPVPDLFAACSRLVDLGCGGAEGFRAAARALAGRAIQRSRVGYGRRLGGAWGVGHGSSAVRALAHGSITGICQVVLSTDCWRAGMELEGAAALKGGAAMSLPVVVR